MRRIAYAARENSKDPSTRVGAVVYDDRGLVGSGFNRFPNGTPTMFWEDRKLKYAMVIHAEAVALIDAGRSARGCSLGTTEHPCVSCAILAAEAGIRRVVYAPRPWRNDPAVIETCEMAEAVFRRAGIEVVHV
jgi:dCMP deaminase